MGGGGGLGNGAYHHQTHNFHRSDQNDSKVSLPQLCHLLDEVRVACVERCLAVHFLPAHRLCIIARCQLKTAERLACLVVEVHSCCLHPGVVGVTRIINITLVNLKDKHTKAKQGMNKEKILTAFIDPRDQLLQSKGVFTRRADFKCYGHKYNNDD